MRNFFVVNNNNFLRISLLNEKERHSDFQLLIAGIKASKMP